MDKLSLTAKMPRCLRKKWIAFAAFIFAVFIVGFLAAPNARLPRSVARTAQISSDVPDGWDATTQEHPYQKIAVSGLWRCAPQLSVCGPFQDPINVVYEGKLAKEEIFISNSGFVVSRSRRTCISKENVLSGYVIAVTESNQTFVVKIEFSDVAERASAFAWLKSITFDGINLFDQSKLDLIQKGI